MFVVKSGMNSGMFAVFFVIEHFWKSLFGKSGGTYTQTGDYLLADLILPNMNTAEPLAAKTYLTPQKEQILDFISQNGQITEAEIMKLLGVKRTRAYTVAKQLCDENLIVAVGRGVNKKYIAQGCIA